MTLTITPTLLGGCITPPPGKSQTHRLMIAAALADGESIIENYRPSEDLHATLRGTEALGATVRIADSALRVTGVSLSAFPRDDLPVIHCGESGSTLRFLLPVAVAVAGGGIFTGSERLMARPLQPYFDLFETQGIQYRMERNTLHVRGQLRAGEFHLPGNVSSQFFTGLLFALPLLHEPSVIIPDSRIESFGYVGMTLQALSEFGIHIPATCSLPPQYHISGDALYRPCRTAVEGDWSQAAFWYAATGIGNRVSVSGMNESSLQGDRAILDFARQLSSDGCVTLDLSDHPDLAPPLAAWGALREGETRLVNTARLRLKESDRLTAITESLAALGADIREKQDGLVLTGKGELAGGVTVDCRNDHRIAMMLAIAATRCRHPVTLTGAECVNKSYPGFWSDFTALGGIIHEHTGE